MANSPFASRSGMTARSPPPPPISQPSPRAPAPEPTQQEEESIPAVSTPEIQNWMKSIEQALNEICALSEGKLNTEQKLRINGLCRKVAHGTSQMAVQYQSLKQKAIQTHTSLQNTTEKIDLSQRILDLKQCIEESSKPKMVTKSFADMVKRNSSSFIQPTNTSSVAIYPTDKQKSSEETKSLVQKIIRPEEMKLHVRGFRKIRNGGVVISTNSKDDVEKLKQSTQLKTSGLTVDEPQKRRPRIVVIGVPAAMQEMEVFNCIYQQNLADKIQDMTIEKFLACTKLSHKSGKKEAETCNYVIEVPALIRKALINNDRVFVNWSSCPVKDFTLVTRCYKCQQYGHAAKSCKKEYNICGHCGEEGHELKSCPKKAEPSKCATCMHFNKPCNHKTGDAECPAKLIAEKRYINSIDYEGA